MSMSPSLQAALFILLLAADPVAGAALRGSAPGSVHSRSLMQTGTSNRIAKVMVALPEFHRLQDDSKESIEDLMRKAEGTDTLRSNYNSNKHSNYSNSDGNSNSNSNSNNNKEPNNNHNSSSNSNSNSNNSNSNSDSNNSNSNINNNSNSSSFNNNSSNYTPVTPDVTADPPFLEISDMSRSSNNNSSNNNSNNNNNNSSNNNNSNYGPPFLEISDLSRRKAANVAQLQELSRLIDVNNDRVLSSEELKQFALGLKERSRWNQTSMAFQRVDADRNGKVTLLELQAASQSRIDVQNHQLARFRAADSDGDERLNISEFHSFLHPELSEEVFKVEQKHQFNIFDSNDDGCISYEEFKKQRHAQNQIDFEAEEEEAAHEDFVLHDVDGNNELSYAEFASLLAGHELLSESIEKAIEAGDSDGDGHIHVEEELPKRLKHLLESEFVEDLFLHPEIVTKLSKKHADEL